MNPLRVVVFGAGGHGRVVADIVRACGWKLEGFLDDDPKNNVPVLGSPVFVADEWLGSGADCGLALGVGDNRAREAVAKRIRKMGATLVSAIHPSAVISASAQVGEGVVMMPGAVLNSGCRVGEGAIINTGAVVEHDVQVGRYAHVSSNSTAGGGAQIGDYSLIGLAATVLPGRRVGNGCIIGAGALVAEHVQDGQLAYGVPERVHVNRR
jgi:sugar O-acyltransferase (sialic acid O-acetyltransferase NeuD family)